MSTSLRGMYCTGGYDASFKTSASLLSAMTRPPSDTTTRPGLRSMVIGWSGPGILIGFEDMVVSRSDAVAGGAVSPRARATGGSSGGGALTDRNARLSPARFVVQVHTSADRHVSRG